MVVFTMKKPAPPISPSLRKTISHSRSQKILRSKDHKLSIQQPLSPPLSKSSPSLFSSNTDTPLPSKKRINVPPRQRRKHQRKGKRRVKIILKMPKNGICQLYMSHAFDHMANCAFYGEESDISRAQVEFELLSEIDKQEFPIECKLSWYHYILATDVFDGFWANQARRLKLPPECTVGYIPDYSLIEYDEPFEKAPELTEDNANYDVRSDTWPPISPNSAIRAEWLARPPTPPGEQGTPCPVPMSSRPGPFIKEGVWDESDEEGDEPIAVEKPETDPITNLDDIDDPAQELGVDGEPADTKPKKPSSTKRQRTIDPDEPSDPAPSKRQKTSTPAPTPDPTQPPKGKGKAKPPAKSSKPSVRRTPQKGPKSAKSAKRALGAVDGPNDFEAVAQPTGPPKKPLPYVKEIDDPVMSVGGPKRSRDEILEDDEPQPSRSTGLRKKRAIEDVEGDGEEAEHEGKPKKARKTKAGTGTTRGKKGARKAKVVEPDEEEDVEGDGGETEDEGKPKKARKTKAGTGTTKGKKAASKGKVVESEEEEEEDLDWMLGPFGRGFME